MGCQNSHELVHSEERGLQLRLQLRDAEQLDSEAAIKVIRQVELEIASFEDESREELSVVVLCLMGRCLLKVGERAHAVESLVQAGQMAEAHFNSARRPFSLLQAYSVCMVTLASVRSEEKNGVAASELTLLRCIEVIEEVHSRRSEHLIGPLLELSAIYRRHGLFNRAELLLRRCAGILVTQHFHDPRTEEIYSALKALADEKEQYLIQKAATKIQKTYRMHCEMKKLAKVLRRPLHRHVQMVADDHLPAQNLLAELCSAEREGGAPCAPVFTSARNPFDAATRPRQFRRTDCDGVAPTTIPRMWIAPILFDDEK